jgi:signal transduction histidine kinase
MRRRFLLAGIAVLSAIAVLTPAYRLQALSWAHAFVAAALFVLPCVALGWGVWRVLLRRSRSSLALAVPAHVLMAIAFSLSWTALFAGLVYLWYAKIPIAFLREGAVWQFIWGLVIYAVLVQAARMQARLQRQQQAAASAELQALRAQLDPHFLFNTLHSLTQLAREDPRATQDAIERFGELMRYVLAAGRDATSDVSLEEDLGLARNYLALEQLRLGDRLRVIEEIEPDALELAVPPLLLQPLVENAVRHGLAPRRGGGTIRLRARVPDEMLEIEVADDGNGAPPGSWRHSDGLGLQVVARQLAARCPGASDLEIKTGIQEGFAVQLRIPARIPARAPQ